MLKKEKRTAKNLLKRKKIILAASVVLIFSIFLIGNLTGSQFLFGDTFLNGGGGTPPENGYTPLVTLDEPTRGKSYDWLTRDEYTIEVQDVDELRVRCTYEILICVHVWDRDSNLNTYDIDYRISAPSSAHITVTEGFEYSSVESGIIINDAEREYKDIEVSVPVTITSDILSGLAEIVLEVSWFVMDQNLNINEGVSGRTLVLSTNAKVSLASFELPVIFIGLIVLGRLIKKRYEDE